jgi:hypothetical protein
MTKQIQIHATEHTKKLVRDISRMKVPVSFINEMELYIQRNLLLLAPNGEKICCPNCLAAHMLKKSRQMNIHSEELSAYIKEMDVKIGHGSYYLDGEELLSI